MNNKTHGYLLACGLLLFGIVACSPPWRYDPWRVNVPEIISSSSQDNEMRRWTLVDHITDLNWDLMMPDGNPTPVWRRLVVCYDPAARFWIYNDYRVNAATNSPAQMQWLAFSVKDDKTEVLADSFPNRKTLTQSMHGTPFVSLHSTNIFDVAAFQKELPGCDALFLSTDKKRGNKAFFKKYGFTYADEEDVGRTVQLSFWRARGDAGRFINLSTDNFHELVDYMKQERIGFNPENKK